MSLYKIAPLIEKHFTKLNSGGVSHDVMALLSIPYRCGVLDMDCNVLHTTFIANGQSAIRSCLLDEKEDIVSIFTFQNIDFVNGECELVYGIVRSVDEKILASAVMSLCDWGMKRAGLTTIHCKIHESSAVRANVPIDGLQPYCVDRIVDEGERDCVISYFDQFMHFPLSQNPNGELSRKHMIAASNVLMAYNKTPLGFISFYANDMVDHIGYIASVVVSEGCRGKGIGRTLIEKCREICKVHGMERINLRVSRDNVNALYFYQRIGFKEENENSGKDKLLYMSI